MDKDENRVGFSVVCGWDGNIRSFRRSAKILNGAGRSFKIEMPHRRYPNNTAFCGRGLGKGPSGKREHDLSNAAGRLMLSSLFSHCARQ